MPRFLISPQDIRQNSVVLDADESRHALKVLRVAVGAIVDLLDGQGKSYRGIVTSVQNGRVEIVIQKTASKREEPLQIVLAPAVIKPDRMEWLVEKTCELGVSALSPVLSSRSVVRLSAERWESKTARWQKIAAQTCKQCGLAKTPQIHPVISLNELIKKFRDFDLILIPTLFGDTLPLADCLEKHDKVKKVLVLIGPEGDFTPEEISLAVGAGAQSISLGSLVLRSETASLYCLAAIRHHFSKVLL